jgi:hypothetical protein
VGGDLHIGRCHGIRRQTHPLYRARPRADFTAELNKVFTPDELQEIRKANDTIISKLGSHVASVPGPFVGFQANGWLGQYLVVIPRDHIVAVRMMRAHSGADEKALLDFPALITKLPSAAPTSTPAQK